MAVTEEHPEHQELGQMTLFEHLAKLRKRLTICILGVAVGAILCWFLYNHITNFMIQPYHEFLRHHHSKDISHGQLVTLSPLEGVSTRLKVSAYGGIALSSPLIFWELWRFITPGLHKNEKRYIIPFVTAGAVLFALGVGTAVLIFPKALDWLIDVSGTNVVPLFGPTKYFTLYVAMCVIFGAVFMYPLIIIFLELSGVVPSARWRKWRRMAIVVICAVAAIIIPSSDPFSFMAMAIPMYLFYEGSILLGRILHK